MYVAHPDVMSHVLRAHQANKSQHCCTDKTLKSFRVNKQVYYMVSDAAEDGEVSPAWEVLFWETSGVAWVEEIFYPVQDSYWTERRGLPSLSEYTGVCSQKGGRTHLSFFTYGQGESEDQ